MNKTASQAPRLWSLVASLVFASEAQAAVLVYGPTTYRQTSDSPWYAAIQGGTVYLETFENRRYIGERHFETPYITAPSGGIGPGNGIHSVDGDDGNLDLLSQFAGAFGGPFATDDLGGFRAKLRFDFVPDANGHLPRYVGFVMTRIGLLSGGPAGYERIRVYDAGANEIGGLAPFGPFPDTVQGITGNLGVNYTGESQFIGVFSESGISSISLQNAYYVDHLQYGFVVPEPGSLLLLLAGAGLFFRARHRPGLLTRSPRSSRSAPRPS